MSKRVVLTVSGVIPADIREQIASGHPGADYLELARNFNADLLDYAAARKKRVPNGRGSREVGGPMWFSPMLAGRKVQAIFTDGEQIGLPLAAPFDNRACHLELKKAVFVDWLGVQSAIDRFVTYSRWQQRSIEDRWKLSRNRGL